MDFKHLKTYLFNFLFGALGAVFILVLKSYLAPVEPPVQFAVVDTQKIVEMQFFKTLQTLSSTNANKDENLEQANELFIQHLLATANEVSKANNLILLAPQASLTQLPDLTDAFLENLGLQGATSGK